MPTAPRPSGNVRFGDPDTSSAEPLPAGCLCRGPDLHLLPPIGVPARSGQQRRDVVIGSAALRGNGHLPRLSSYRGRGSLSSGFAEDCSSAPSSPSVACGGCLSPSGGGCSAVVTGSPSKRCIRQSPTRVCGAGNKTRRRAAPPISRAAIEAHIGPLQRAVSCLPGALRLGHRTALASPLSAVAGAETRQQPWGRNPGRNPKRGAKSHRHCGAISS